MKNVIIYSILVGMMIATFSCQKPKDRPATLDTSIQNQIVPMDSLSDVTSADNQTSQANIDFMKRCIDKISDTNTKNNLELLLSQNKLTYLFVEGKVILLEVTPSTDNKHSESASATATAADDGIIDFSHAVAHGKKHNLPSLIQLKASGETNPDALKDLTLRMQETSTQTNTTGFTVLAQIGMKTGVLDNELTDYNQKKSVLNLRETSLDEAQYVMLTDEIKDDASSDSQL